jgi:ubiquinone/menaquinone biosynthesis C-methylase UbiE
MRQAGLDILRAPKTGEALRYLNEGKDEYLFNSKGDKYPIEKNLIRFLSEEELTGNNKSYQKMYDRLSSLYDFITKTYATIRNGGEENRLLEYLSKLQVKDSDKVIEISIGTGRNIKYLNQKAEYFGVDISLGMLKRCAKIMDKNKCEIVLLQAEAEYLPLCDEAFDVVFSAGGFNFFNDPGKALLEMLRIAKSGSKILISDETEKVRSKFNKFPGSSKFYGQDKIASPEYFVPEYCTDIKYEEICKGELYALTFRKP